LANYVKSVDMPFISNLVETKMAIQEVSVLEFDNVTGGIAPAAAILLHAALRSPVVHAWALNGARAVGGAIAAGGLDAWFEELTSK
jgi:hypothetical protein